MTSFITSSLSDRVAFDRYGSGPAAIFVAGAGPARATDSMTSVTAQLVAEEGFSAFVYDRLGRGESGCSGRIGLDRELAAIDALVEIAQTPAILVGHSSGGAIALRAAAAGLPVAGLVLWETPTHQISGGAPDWSAEVERRIDAGDLEGALEYYMKDMPPEWLEGARKSPAFPAMVANVVTYRADGQALAWLESDRLEYRVSAIRVPVETVVGAETFPLMQKSAEMIAQAIPNAVSKTLPGSGHAWEPETFAAELGGFLQRVTSTTT